MGLLIDNLSKLYLPYRMRLDEEEAVAKQRERWQRWRRRNQDQMLLVFLSNDLGVINLPVWQQHVQFDRQRNRKRWMMTM
jgi:hypothetical protein